MHALPIFLFIGFFLLAGAFSFVATVVRMRRGRYDPWIRCIADLLVSLFIMGFAAGMGLLVLHAGSGAGLMPGFAVLAASGLALAVSFIIRARTGGGIGPTPGPPDPEMLARSQALVGKVLRFVGAPPQAVAAASHLSAPRTLQPIPLPPSTPNPCAAPPRPVPLLTRVQVMFGGPFNQFGWAFFGFGMIFFWLFVCRADLTSWYRFRGPVATVQGRVTDSRDSGASEGGSKGHRGTPIYQNDYSFVIEGKEYHGVSYALGRELPPGRAVTIEYPAGQPQFSRIQGMRTNVFGPAVLLVVIFPLIGLGAILFGLASGLRACRLLADGIPSSGRLMLKEDTNTRVNKKMVYKYTFAYKTRHGEVCTATTRTIADRFGNGAEEHLLYDPLKPQRALLLDTLPGAPDLRDDGHLATRRPVLALANLILPLVTILGHGYWALKLLGH